MLLWVFLLSLINGVGAMRELLPCNGGECNAGVSAQQRILLAKNDTFIAPFNSIFLQDGAARKQEVGGRVRPFLCDSWRGGIGDHWGSWTWVGGDGDGGGERGGRRWQFDMRGSGMGGWGG